MGFSLRKSVRFGPFRFNLSTSGIGASVGVPGFRVGAGPRGRYVSMSAGGVTYRSAIGGRRQPGTSPSSPSPSPSPSPSLPESGAVTSERLTEITSGAVLDMVDGSAEELLATLNGAARRKPWLAILLVLVGLALVVAPVLGSGVLLAAIPGPPPNAPPVEAPARPSYVVQSGDTLSVIARQYAVSVDDLRTWNAITGDLIEVGEVLLVAPPPAPAPVTPVPVPVSTADETSVLLAALSGSLSVVAFGLAAASFAGAAFAWWRHRVNCTTVLMYDLDEPAEARVRALYEGIDELSRAARVWHIASEGAVRDRKYHAGASSLITRSLAPVRRGDPPGIRTNVTIPALPAGREVLYFMPDRLLVYDSWRQAYGAVPYEHVGVDVGTTRFIEEGSVPRDGKVVDETWAKVNRDGGPDRRFKDNRRLPVCEYGTVDLTSDSGLRESFQVSLPSAAPAFGSAVRAMAGRADDPPAGGRDRAAPTPEITDAQKEAVATAILLKSVAVADRKVTDAERAAMRDALCAVFGGDAWVAANAERLLEVVKAGPEDVDGASALLATSAVERRAAVLQHAEALAQVDGKVTPKENERLRELRALLGSVPPRGA